MQDDILLEELIRAVDHQLQAQQSGIPKIRHDRVQDELSGIFSDIEFLDKPKNMALLYFMYGIIKPLEDSQSKEYTIRYLEQILAALKLAERGLKPNSQH